MHRDNRLTPKEPRRFSRFQEFPDHRAIWPVNARRSPDDFTYLVAWGSGANEIVKVGVTQGPARWRSFVGRGATVVRLYKAYWRDAIDLEIHTQAALDVIAPRAFRRREEAMPYLPGGHGWMECYRVSREIAAGHMEEVQLALVQG